MMEKNGLVKLVEELGELSQIAAKKMAFMDTDNHPDGDGSMKERLEKEIADVFAAGIFVIERFDLDTTAIDARAQKKHDLFEYWHGGGKEIAIPDA